MSKKRTAAGESILLTKTVGGLYDDVIEFCHAPAVKAKYGSAVNAVRFAIEDSKVYQDWKEAREEEITAQRTRSAGGQFVAAAEQNAA